MFLFKLYLFYFEIFTNLFFHFLKYILGYFYSNIITQYCNKYYNDVKITTMGILNYSLNCIFILNESPYILLA